MCKRSLSRPSDGWQAVCLCICGGERALVLTLAGRLGRVFAQAIAEDSQLVRVREGKGMIKRQRRMRRDLEKEPGGGEKRA